MILGRFTSHPEDLTRYRTTRRPSPTSRDTTARRRGSEGERSPRQHSHVRGLAGLPPRRPATAAHRCGELTCAAHAPPAVPSRRRGRTTPPIPAGNGSRPQVRYPAARHRWSRQESTSSPTLRGRSRPRRSADLLPLVAKPDWASRYVATWPERIPAGQVGGGGQATNPPRGRSAFCRSRRVRVWDLFLRIRRQVDGAGGDQPRSVRPVSWANLANASGSRAISIKTVSCRRRSRRASSVASRSACERTSRTPGHDKSHRSHVRCSRACLGASRSHRQSRGLKQPEAMRQRSFASWRNPIHFGNE